MARQTQGYIYQARLQTFLSRIEHIRAMSPKGKVLHEIMDTVPFRDLETALMMATMDVNQMAVNDR